MPYIKVSTSASGARTVQLATKVNGHTKIIKHFGSAHTESELLALKAKAHQVLHNPTGQSDLFAPRFELNRVRVTGASPRLLSTSDLPLL